jgi:Asp-tRNA(Asn)/Glu-tRNA(Gln) amidotransferase A subunit family amidase
LLQADDLHPVLKSSLVMTEHLLERYQGVPFARAHNLRLEVRRQLVGALSDVDVLVTPTTAGVAFELVERRVGPEEFDARLEEGIASVANTVQCDLSGHPAVTVPAGTGAHGLPVGLQIIGPHFAEELCYQVAFAFEASSR